MAVGTAGLAETSAAICIAWLNKISVGRLRLGIRALVVVAGSLIILLVAGVIVIRPIEESRVQYIGVARIAEEIPVFKRARPAAEAIAVPIMIAVMIAAMIPSVISISNPSTIWAGKLPSIREP